MCQQLTVCAVHFGCEVTEAVSVDEYRSSAAIVGTIHIFYINCIVYILL